MGAPTPAVRLTPAGRKLGKGSGGVGVVFAITADLNIEFFEDELTPSGFECDAPNDITDQHNVSVHTFSPGSDLITDDDVVVLAKYDPVTMSALRAIAGVATTGTTYFPDGATYAQYGYVHSAKYSSIKRGEVPMVTVTFKVTNVDSNCAEQPGVYTAGTGTSLTC